MMQKNHNATRNIASIKGGSQKPSRSAGSRFNAIHRPKGPAVVEQPVDETLANRADVYTAENLGIKVVLPEEAPRVEEATQNFLGSEILTVSDAIMEGLGIPKEALSEEESEGT